MQCLICQYIIAKCQNMIKRYMMDKPLHEIYNKSYNSKPHHQNTALLSVENYLYLVMKYLIMLLYVEMFIASLHVNHLQSKKVHISARTIQRFQYYFYERQG